MNLALAIDGDNFVHVQWHGSQGKADCAAALRSLVDDYTRRYRARVAICFDPPELTWRHLLYADYKGTRGPAAQARHREVERQLLELHGIRVS